VLQQLISWRMLRFGAVSVLDDDIRKPYRTKLAGRIAPGAQPQPGAMEDFGQGVTVWLPLPPPNRAEDGVPSSLCRVFEARGNQVLLEPLIPDWSAFV